MTTRGQRDAQSRHDHARQELIFVYNGDSPLLSQLGDYVRKIVSPRSYPCTLCKVTYGNLGMKREWKRFVATLRTHTSFYHSDEFHEQFPALRNIRLPAVFLRDQGDGEPRELIATR